MMHILILGCLLQQEMIMANFTKPVTDSTFETDVLNSSTPVLVDFWAEWCGPCRALAPKLEEVAQELDAKVKIVKLNVDENPSTPGKYGIRGIPAMLLFKGGKEVGQLVGNHPKDAIVDFLSKNS
jgi:thioredoxin 1